jgi:hypothetical protein
MQLSLHTYTQKACKPFVYWFTRLFNYELRIMNYKSSFMAFLAALRKLRRCVYLSSVCQKLPVAFLKT